MTRATTPKTIAILVTVLLAVVATARPTSAEPPVATGTPAIQAKAISPVTARGVPVVVLGKVEPIGLTPRVVLQRLVEGRWRDVTRPATVKPDTGEFHFTAWPKTVGTYSLRVRSIGGSVVSQTMTLKVLPLVQSWPAVPAG